MNGDLQKKRTIIGIIVGIITILTFFIGITISLAGWKTTQDYNIKTLETHDAQNAKRLTKLEDTMNMNNVRLKGIETKLDFIIKQFEKDK